MVTQRHLELALRIPLESGYQRDIRISWRRRKSLLRTFAVTRTLLPAAYLGGAGTSTSNDQFKTWFELPVGRRSGERIGIFLDTGLHAYNGAPGTPTYGNAIPQAPGVGRNSLVRPGYRDVDMTLAKNFGLPKLPVLGENAKFEFRVDAYNVFNNLNFNPMPDCK